MGSCSLGEESLGLDLARMKAVCVSIFIIITVKYLKVHICSPHFGTFTYFYSAQISNRQICKSYSLLRYHNKWCDFALNSNKALYSKQIGVADKTWMLSEMTSYRTSRFHYKSVYDFIYMASFYSSMSSFCSLALFCSGIEGERHPRDARQPHICSSSNMFEVQWLNKIRLLCYNFAAEWKKLVTIIIINS